MGSYQPVIKRIAIIGAGPIGLACSKFLLAEKHFDVINVYEQRSNVGGIWNLSDTERSKRIPIPQTDPRYGSHGKTTLTNDHSLEFESPLYDYLETNIPKELMAYSDTPFADELQLFPGHLDVLEYLEAYASDVKHLIKFNSQVQDVQLACQNETESWILVAINLITKEIITATYDAVIIGNGHYTVPRVPDITGIANWNLAYPGSIIHSKAYRRPGDFEKLRAMVIGNSASGLDIAAQLSQSTQHPVIMSSRSASQLSSGSTPSWREDVDELAEFLPPTTHHRAVRTKSGRIITDLDAVIFATGYFYTFPFLSSLQPPIITDGSRTKDVYQHFLHIRYPTLALPVLNLKVIPFPLAENQAAVIARLWSGRLPMPTQPEMLEWEAEEYNRTGSDRAFHLKRFPQDAAQINDLHEWALSATPRHGLANNGNGKLGSAWDERKVWMRSKFPAIKAQFAAEGDQRHYIKTIEELGFDFEEWRQNAKTSDHSMFQDAHCLN